MLEGAAGQAPGLCSGTLHVVLRNTGTWPHRHLRVSSSAGGQQGRGLQPRPVPYPAGEQGRLGTAVDIRHLPGDSILQSAVCAVSQRYKLRCPPCLVFCLMGFAF